MIFIKLFMTNKYFHHRRIYIYDFTFLFKIYTVSPLLITTDSLENLTLSLTLKGFIVIFCYFYCHDHIILMSWYIYIYIFLYLYMIKIEYYHICENKCLPYEVSIQCITSDTRMKHILFS